MTSFLNKLRAYHQAFWVFDPWYRRAWYAGPPALAATLLTLLMIPGATVPTGAPWAKPVGGEATTAVSPDWKLCSDASTANVPRGEACDRLITAGKLTASELGWAYFGRAWMKETSNDLAGALADYAQAVKADPSNASATNNLGGIHLLRNELDLALRSFDAAIRLTPNGANAQALANKAEVFRRQGKLADAQGETKKALDADRNNARARQVQDLILADLKKAEAEREAGPDLPACLSAQTELKARGAACDKLIKQGKLPAQQMAEAYFGRGWTRESANDIAGAIVDYSEAVKLNPNSAGAFNNRGGLLLNRGEFGDALRDFDEAIRINQRFAFPLANKAEVLRRQGKLAEAQTEVGKALAIESNNPRAKAVQDLITADLRKQQSPRTDPPVSAKQGTPAKQEATGRQDPATDALRKRATAHQDNNDLDSAIADWTEVIRKGEATWLDYHERGRAYLRKGQNTEALADLDRAVARNGHGASAHFNRALLHERLNQPDKARDDLVAAIDQHGATDPDYFTKLGGIHAGLGRHALAVQTYDKLIALHDKSKTVKPNDRALAFMLRGIANKNLVIAERQRCPGLIPPDPNCMNPARFGIAMADFQQALIYRPGYGDVLFEQGWIAAEIGNAKGAVEQYSAAIRANPKNAAAYNNRGVQYEKLKQPELAFADYNDAIRLDDRNKFAWTNRAILFANNRQRQRAIEDLRKALLIDGQHPAALRELQKLGVRP